MLVDQAEEQVCIWVCPISIQYKVQVLSSLVVVLSLYHEGGKEQAHIDVHIAARALNRLVKALLSLDLQTVAEAELSELFPFLCIVRLVNQMIYEVFLSIFDVTNRVKFKCKTVELLGCALVEALVILVFTRHRNGFKLSDNVRVQVVPLSRQNCLVKARFHLFLEEDVQLSL